MLSLRKMPSSKGQILVAIAILLMLGLAVAGLLVNHAYLKNNAESLAIGALRNSALSALQHTDPCMGFGRYYIKIEDHPTEPSCNNGPDSQPLPTADTIVRQLLHDNLVPQERLYSYDVDVVLDPNGSNGGDGLDVEVINYDPAGVDHVASLNNVPYPPTVNGDGHVISQLTGAAYSHSIVAVRLRLPILQLNQPDIQLDRTMVVQAGER